MLVNQLKYSAFFFLIFLISCGHQRSKNTGVTKDSRADSSIRYAKRFSLVNKEGNIFVYLFGNRNNFDTTASYLLAHDTSGLKGRYASTTIIKSPCKKIAALSSIYAAMICEVGACSSIAAIDNVDYLNNEFLTNEFKHGSLLELAKSPELDIEKTISLMPDMLFTFGMGDGKGNEDSKLQLSGLSHAVCVDHLEETPLARAEWIKFFAAFVERSKEADSIFDKVEHRYTELKELTLSGKHKPTVFSETKFGDVWYMPGGNSYMSKILQDAGANYLWSNNKDVGSLPLSFEQVYAKAREAEFWINLPLVSSKKELISFESRYAEFEAFKNNKMYNNTLHTNAGGYSTYWETGMMHPERILSDLAQIFHPELKSRINSEMFYYQALKN